MIAALKSYHAYRDSGVKWLGEMPDGWTVMPVKRMARINPRKSEVPLARRAGPPVVFLSMERVKPNGAFDASKTVAINDVWDGFSYFRRGDVIVAKITPCFENGKGASLEGLSTDFGFGSTEFIVLRPSSRVLSKYLNALVSLPAFRNLGAEAMQGAGGQRRVPTEFVANFTFAIPPMHSQKSIIRFLDHVNSRIQRLIARKECLVELLREEKQAFVNSVVTCGLDSSVSLKPSDIEWLGDIPEHWDVLDLGRMIDLLPGYAFSSSSFTEDEQDLRLLRGVNIEPGRIRWDETVRWPSDLQENFDTYRLVVGDLVLGLDRPVVSAGIRVARVTARDAPSLLLQRVARIRTRSGLLSEYLEFLLRGELFRRYIVPLFTGVSVPHLSPDQVKRFRIALPPLDEQRRIVTSLVAEASAVGTAIDSTMTQIELLREYRTRLISDVVTGKLDVREAAANLPDDPDADDPALDERLEEVAAG